jgi:hypothetical protein
MSSAADAVQARPANLWFVRRMCEAAALYRLPVYAACTVAALTNAYLLGKDLTWDTFNYHLYAGFSALHDRFAQDYFAAGVQSYLNPYVFVPFYAMTHLGLSALAIGAILTVWHSALLWLTYELAVATCPAAVPRVRLTIGICAVVLATLNALVLQQLGSSFADITTGELVLGGWVLLARAVHRPRAALVICAAALLGAAAALKLTNSVHIIGAAVVILFLPLTLAGRSRYAALYAVVVALAFLVLAAPWGYALSQHFGNPLFPMFNNIFHSPDFPPEQLRLVRFVPANLGEALWRPFAMLDPMPGIHDEMWAPEERYALLIVLGGALLLKRLWQRFRARTAQPAAAAPPTEPRVLAALGCGLAVDWALWLATSGNSRYFIPLACVASVLVVGLLPWVLGPPVRKWAPAFALLAAVQLVQIAMNPGLRWAKAYSWDDGPWLGVEVPQRLKTEPALYFSMGSLSNSFMVAYVNPASGFVNFTGSYGLGPEGASGQRIEALIHHYAPHLRLLAVGDQLYNDLKHLPNIADVDGALSRFGLRVDPADCTTIAVSLTREMPDNGHMISCTLRPDTSVRAALAPAQPSADLILDRLESACPELFQPRHPLTEYRNHRWLRSYLNTDVHAWVSRGWVKIQNTATGDGPFFVGRDTDWLAAPQRVSCGRRANHDYIRILAPDTQ